MAFQVGDPVLAVSDGRRSNPVLALPWLDVHDVHGVDFLEGPAVGFVDEEVGDDGSGSTTCAEDITVPIIDSAGDEGRKEAE